MLADFFLLTTVVLFLSWCFILCDKKDKGNLSKGHGGGKKQRKAKRKKEQTKRKKNTQRDKQGAGGMPKTPPTVPTPATTTEKKVLIPSKEASVPTDEKKSASNEKEGQPEEKKESKESTSLMFGPVVDNEPEPEGTNLEDIPDDMNPLLDRSVQNKLLPAHVLARKQKTKGEPVIRVQKTQSSHSSLYASVHLNNKQSGLKTPPGNSEKKKKAGSNETYVAEVLKTSKKGSKKKIKEHSLKNKNADPADISQDLEHH